MNTLRAIWALLTAKRCPLHGRYISDFCGSCIKQRDARNSAAEEPS